MDAVLVSAIRIGLLVLLWVFIVSSVLAMRADTNRISGTRGRGANGGRFVSASGRPRQAGSVHREKPRFLTVVEGPLTGSHMDVSQAESITLGRGQNCEFVLGDDYASSRHARLFRRGGDWFVEDLESRNGTFVNGFRIDQPERVQVGTDIKMGGTTVRLAP